jgi:Fe-S-cluster containining protein
MSKTNDDRNPSIRWYAAGLAFECTQCGDCCSGPGEGVIWVCRHEISLIADHLKLSESDLREQYMKRIGTRTTIIEEPVSKDCIFLKRVDGRKVCGIYSVRPNQCRTYPFWSENLKSPTTWNQTAQECPGVNRGPCHGFGAIEKLRKQKKWWDHEQT